MFVRYSCGCVGLRIQGQRDITIKGCEGGEPPCFSNVRPLSDKTATPLSDTERDELINEIGRLLADGDRYRQLRQLLAIPSK